MKNQSVTTKLSIIVFVFSLILIISGCHKIPTDSAASDKYRLVWNSNPETSITIAWDQLQPSEIEVLYGKTDNGKKYWKYKNKVAPSAKNDKYEMKTHFAKLEGLTPGTNYYFVLKDNYGVSNRYWFKTAPAKKSAFTFVAGGDTKSEGKALEAGRASNRMVKILRPLFVMFVGDFNSGNGTDPLKWKQWLTDWQQQTTTEDGQMIPIFPIHGNHENGDHGNLNYIFNSPYQKNDSSNIYYSVSFGNNFIHLIALNSEIENGKDQRTWLEEDLKKNEECTFKFAGYHKPFWPHTSHKSENKYQFNQWVWLFDKYGLDLSFDADSHMHKITYPLRPDTISANAEMGFVRDDKNGTMYIGEGSWGATPRKTDDNKSWTMNSGSFNQVKWVHVFPDNDETPAHLDIYTIKTASYDNKGNQTLYNANVTALTEDNLFEIPANITIFEDERFGKFVRYPFNAAKK